MKNPIIVFLDEDINYKDSLMKILKEWFPQKYFEIEIYNFRKVNINDFFNSSKFSSPPLIICYGISSKEIEQIKSYSLRYLISPNTDINFFNNINEYDKKNTYCLFGDTPKEIDSSIEFFKHYPHTFNGLCKGKLNLINGIVFCGIFYRFITKGQKNLLLNK